MKQTCGLKYSTYKLIYIKIDQELLFGLGKGIGTRS